MATSIDTYSDIEDDDDLTETFTKATEHVKTLISKIPQQKLLELYGYYKQATEGACNISRPPWYEMKAKSKWDAWNNLGNLDSDQAKRNYIRSVTELDPLWNTSEKKTEFWVSVSTFKTEDSVLDESQKSVYDHVKEGDVDKVSLHLKNRPELLNELDESGLGIIHWAADRGNANILRCLMEHDVDINIKDEDGQTALHYAVSCDHYDCVKLLLENGIDTSIKDNDGTLASELSNNDNITELFNNFVQ